MRLVFAVASLVGALLLAAPAAAERRIFIIANHPDGYGVDRCLATGAGCGAMVATAYCRSHDFVKALSFRKVERDEVTGAAPMNGSAACRGSCEEFVAIECER